MAVGVGVVPMSVVDVVDVLDVLVEAIVFKGVVDAAVEADMNAVLGVVVILVVIGT